MTTRTPRPNLDQLDCRVCKTPRPEYAQRPFGWDVDYDADTGVWSATCSPACRAQIGLKERF